jgi:DnaD/phage-associated family protein
MTPIPEPFFADLLPQIDHLGELKVTLYIFWVLTRQEQRIHYLARGAMTADQNLLAALAASPEEGKPVLEEALARATARGTLLAVHAAGSDEVYYFLNSPRGRAAAEGLEQGKWKPEGVQTPPADLWLERPNIFNLYEQNIGPLTPLTADVLRDAEKEYPPEWIEEAIRIAVEYNARSWRYVSAILERWKKDGLGEKASTPEERRRRYIEGKYADFIEH